MNILLCSSVVVVGMGPGLVKNLKNRATTAVSCIKELPKECLEMDLLQAPKAK